MGYNYGNRFAIGNNGGRPPIYDNPLELHEKISEYFYYIEGEFEMETISIEQEYAPAETYQEKKWIRHPERPTITGLALFLGFDSRQSLYDYKAKDEFSYSIKRALAIVENYYEMGLDSKTPTGFIFALKNMGWVDKTETETKNQNYNYDAEKLTPEKIREIQKALENDY